MIKKLSADNMVFSINSTKVKNPFELLENLVPIKDNESLTNEEKIQEVEKIIIKYME